MPVIAALDALGFSDDAKDFFVLHVNEDEDHALIMLEILERLTSNDTSARQRAVDVGSNVRQRRINVLDAVLNHVRAQRQQAQNDGTRAGDLKSEGGASGWSGRPIFVRGFLASALAFDGKYTRTPESPLHHERNVAAPSAFPGSGGTRCTLLIYRA